MTEQNARWWWYDELGSGEPYDWGSAARGDHPDDQLDFHLDLGCGRLKKGRLGIDRWADPGVDMVMDLDLLHVAGYGDRAWEKTENPAEGLILIQGRMPFPSDSIESIISHHCLEHVGLGFIRLVDECYRVLKPGGKFRIITPLFPSNTAIADPDHKRYFCENTFETFCGSEDGKEHWHESFSTPYTNARFLLTDKDITARDPDPTVWWTEKDAREIRVTLTKPERS